MSVTDVQRSIRRVRGLRLAVVPVLALNALVLAANIAAGSFFALVNAVAVIACLALAVVQTRMIGTLRGRERELNRPRMTPEDWRQLRETEAELGWELSEPPATVAEPVQPARRTAPVPAECTRCQQGRIAYAGGLCVPCRRQERRSLPAAPGVPMRDADTGDCLSAPMTGPGGRWRPLSELPGVKADDGILAEPLIKNMRRELEGHAPSYAKARSDREITAARAAEHFAALARVGLGSCISCCPICDKRWIEDDRWGGQQ